MIGAILLATLVVFGIGLIFAVQWMVLPIGIALGVLACGDHLRQAGAAVGVLQGRGPARRRGLGAGEHAGLVAGHPGGRGHHAPRRRAPRDRPARASSWSREGAPHRVKGLLAQEKKRHARVVGKTPIYDIVVGNDEGQMPLRKLQRHLMKLPRNISAGEMDSLETRLTALGSRTGGDCPRARCPPGRRCGVVQRDRPPPLTVAALVSASATGADDDRGGRPVVPAPSVASRGPVRAGPGRAAPSAAPRRGTPTSVDRSDATRMPSTAMPGVMPKAATATAVSTNQTPSTVHENSCDASASGPAKIPAMR